MERNSKEPGRKRPKGLPLEPVAPCQCPDDGQGCRMARDPQEPTPTPQEPPPADAAMMAQTMRLVREALLRLKLSLFRFHVKQTEVVVHTDSIVCAICCNDSVTLYTVNGVYPDIKRTLASMEALRELGFLRINLNTVLNVAYYRGRDADRFVKLSCPIAVTLKVSVRYLPALNRFLKTYCH